MTAIRIRRVTNAHDFRTALDGGETDVLPLWFADGERDCITTTVDPKLAALSDGGEHRVPVPAIACDESHIVLAVPDSPLRLARRYAAATDRPLFVAPPDVDLRLFDGIVPASVTWFCNPEDEDLAISFHTVCEHLARATGCAPRLGVLVAEDEQHLSWLLAKQLVPSSARSHTRATTFVSSAPESFRPVLSMAYVGADDKADRIVSAFNDASGTLLVSAHSRPHCGMIAAADGLLGICGLETGGADGRCVNGSACHFANAPRAVLDQLAAQRIYFNGCTTGGIGTRRQDFLPRSSLIALAALRGAAREFVGNVRSGLYSEADLECFVGAAALGYTPAECVGLINGLRRLMHRDAFASCCFFGDAASDAWPVDGAAVGLVCESGDGLQVRWSTLDMVLVARVPNRRWADLAIHDRLHIVVTPRIDARISVLPDPWSDASIVLAVPHLVGDRAAVRPDQEIAVTLRPLYESIDRSVGSVLGPAIERLRWLAALPTFEPLLAGGATVLEGELLALRRAAATRENLADLPNLLAYLRRAESEAACRFDEAILTQALSRSQTRWSWTTEYGHRMQASPREAPATCPHCGALAVDIDFEDFIWSTVRRSTRACGYCGIVSDVPNWPLRCRLRHERLRHSSTLVSGSVEVSNDENRPRRLWLGATVRDAGAFKDTSLAATELVLEPHTTFEWSFVLKPVEPIDKLSQTWVFVVSEGGLGLVGTIVLFAP